MMRLETTSLIHLHRRLRLALLLLVTAVLQLACMAVELSFAQNMNQLAATVVVDFVLMMGLAVAWSVFDPVRQARLVRLLSIIWTLLMVLGAIAMDIGVVPICLLCIAAFAAIYRFVWLHSDRTTAGIQLHFGVDTAALVFFAVFVGVGAWTHSFSLGNLWVSVYSVMTLLTILGWVAVLWSIERALTETAGASRIGVMILLVFALICGLFGLKAVYNTLLFLLGGFGIIMSPVMGSLPKLRISKQQLQKHVHQMQQSRLHLKPLSHVQQIVISPVVVHVVAIVVTVAAAGILCIFVFRKRSAVPKPENEEMSLAIVSRQAAPGSEGLFVPTTDPIRLKLQAWLRRQIRAKTMILSSDTARTWAAQADADDDIRELLPLYERKRYRNEG